MIYLNDKGRPITLSYSGYSTWMDCQRKWYYAYKMRLPQPWKRATWIGGRVHDELEHYGKYGRWKDVEDESEVDVPKAIARAALPYLEQLEGFSLEEGFDETWDVEVRLAADDLLCGPFPFNGYVDYGRPPFIGDYKTRGSFRWLDPPEKLSTHPQPCSYTYAYYHIRGEPIPDTVHFQHLNIHTQPGPLADDGLPTFAVEVVNATASRDQVLENWRKMEEAATGMAKVLDTAEKAEDVPGNTRNCTKYGGCAYADRCPLSPQNRDTSALYTGTNPTNLPDGDPMSTDKQAALRARLKLGKQKPETPSTLKKPEAQAPSTPKKPKAQAFLDTLRNTLENITLPIAAVTKMAEARGMTYDQVRTALDLIEEAGFCKLPTDLGEVEAEEEAPAEAAEDAPVEEVEGETPILTDAQVEDLRDGLKDKHIQALLQCQPSSMLMGLGLQAPDGSRTLKGEYLTQKFGASRSSGTKSIYGDNPPAEIPVDGPEYEDVAALAVQHHLSGRTTSVDRDDLRDVILSVDDTATRVRYSRMENIIDELGLATVWTYNKKAKCFDYVGDSHPEAPEESEDEDDEAPEAQTHAPKFVPAGIAKAFMEEEGWGTPVGPARMWIKSKGINSLDALLNTIGGRVLHGLLVPYDSDGDRESILGEFHPEALDALKKMAAMEKEIGLDKEAPVEEAPVEEAPVEEAPVEEAPVEEAPVEEAPVEEAPVEEAPVEEPGPPKTIVFVDCMPDNMRDVVRFEDFIQFATDMVEAEGGDIDRAFVKPLPYWNLMDYAQGPKRVAGVIAQHMAIHPYNRPAAIVVRSSHPAAHEVLAVLSRLGDYAFVRGVK